MDDLTVLRDSLTDCITVGGEAFRLSTLVNEAFRRVKEAGSKNPAFDAPPWFFSGSPYGSFIRAMNVGRLDKIPDGFTPEFLPQPPPGWAHRKPIWPEVFEDG